ncbi:hypothetical protein IRZ71_21550 [Flavobacterium sp. ANB]|uniref:NACHT domain-containing protein n=1 Tax=unclassified Flavobacterium TaxID=196869 RepID=UPI0012B9C531|nr:MULTISPECIES: hypothetical protein [unclassified Flavobacterium]MBF4518950.1 hypothetical protein [Flavobacterium sp. ANB]MTD71560.1 hypothetical protein [Flavobacterium sp. LC2016-13]
MENTNYYEPRYVNKSQGHTTNWFGEAKDDKTLFDAVFTESKIVLLGNPGVGKTKELEMLFQNLWKSKETTGLIPFSINLKNFRKINKFEDLITYKNWKALPKTIFILDGLDEIAEIHDFVSAFELFVSQNKKLNIGYVISCRTNIYEKYLVNIANFESFYLQDLSEDQAASLLVNKFGVRISDFALSDRHSSYLKTPFFLELFAGYVLEKGILPASDSVMWELFIDRTLDRHEQKQAKKKPLNKLRLLKNLKKVAFTNELMQQNYSSADELECITGDYLEYIENPFTIEMSGEPKRWNFTHRQIQEYLVAKILAEKPFEDMLSIIKIHDISKEVVHPSLFNTITFLINLLDKESDEFKQLVGWLSANQIEILFKADSDRTSAFQERVFQDYFYRQCLNKKLWISTNRAFTVKEIAEFGDSDGNFIYLIGWIKEQKSHFRVVISALNLLGFFRPTHKRMNVLRPLFLELLRSKEASVAVKSEVIRCITSLKMAEHDEDYLDEVMTVFSTECNKEINAALLFMIYFVKDIDRLFWYIKAEFLRNAKIEKRKDTDDVHRGNDWKLMDLTLRLEDYDHFVEIISYYFDDSLHLDIYGGQENNILERFLSFSNSEPDFIVRFLKSINKKTHYHNREQLLLNIVKDSGNELEAAKFLIGNNEFSDVRSFISRFANKEILNYVIEKLYKTGLLNSDEVLFFRNNLSHYNLTFAALFERMMTESGFEFGSDIMTDAELDQRRKTAIGNMQRNFDILFDKKELLQRIKKMYEEHNIEVLENNKLYELGSIWRKENDYPAYFDNSLAILELLLDTYGFLTYDQVLEHLKDSVFIFKIILDSIKGNNRENLQFAVSSYQKDKILEWTVQTSENINFEEVITSLNGDGFSYGSDFAAFKIALSFQRLFKIPLSKAFLLDCLQFYEIDSFNDKEEPFIYLFNEIGDKKAFDDRVTDNILNKKLFKFIMDRHVDYALRHNLRTAFPKIREYFLKQNPGYNMDEKLEIYQKLTGDNDLLKECTSDVQNPICWSAVKLLVLLGEQEFSTTKAVEYLELDENDKKHYYLSNAMWVLFHFNDIKALQYYLEMKSFDFHGVNFSEYTAINNYDVLEILFFRIYKEVYDRSDFSNGASFFDAYISNLSKDDDSYPKVQKALKGIKDKLISEGSDTRLFSINLLIDISDNSYINAKSVPMPFTDALSRVEEILV